MNSHAINSTLRNEETLRAEERQALQQSPLDSLTYDSITAVIRGLEMVTLPNQVKHHRSFTALRRTCTLFSNHQEAKEGAQQFEYLQAAFGAHHGFVLRPDGRLFAYGTNDHGQLGISKLYQCSSVVSKLTEVPTPKNHSIKQVITNNQTTFALSASRKHLYRCGTHHNISALEELKINLPAESRIKQIVMSQTLVWIETFDGKLYEGKISNPDSCLNVKEKQLAKGMLIQKIVAGDDHLVILSQAGKLYACGNNEAGQLGAGNPKKLTDLQEIALPQGVQTISDIAAGNKHTVILADNGVLYSTGENDKGQLGINNTMAQNTFQPINLPLAENAKVIRIAAGDNHTAVLTSDGKLYRCGTNNGGVMGLDSNTTPQLTQLTEISPPNYHENDEKITRIIAGGERLFILTDKDRLYGWDANKVKAEYTADTDGTTQHITQLEQINLDHVRHPYKKQVEISAPSVASRIAP